MQIPGPTLIVTEGQTVRVTLTNSLPTSAGNTSILFPGFNVTATGGVAGLLAQEALPGGSVTYTFTASGPGTRAYYSGTQGDLQIEMGLYGAIIVLPNAAPTAGCPCHNTAAGLDPTDKTGTHLVAGGEQDFRLSPTGAAYHLAQTCYDREYMFQFSEMDPNIHTQALAQVTAKAGCTRGSRRMQPRRSDGAVPSELLPDQWPLHARRHGPELRIPVSAPALQREPAHASWRPGAAPDHRPGPLAASLPRARQPRARPGARRQPDREPERSDTRSPGRCSSPPPPRQARRWTGSSTTPAGA